ncbi:hypothetical protein ACFLXH_04995 [Chloroflexota bacterium]
MADIKSAREIATEKVAKLGEVTEAERLKWEYFPEGEKLAAKYLKEQINLLAQINKYEGAIKEHVTSGAKEILVRNMDLPRNELVKKNNKGAMDGLRILIQDKVAAENVFSKLRRIFDHYLSQGEQQKKQAYESLKAQFTARLQQAMQQQYGSAANFKIDVERQPQFQEEWSKVQGQLESQYRQVLNEYRQELLALK